MSKPRTALCLVCILFLFQAQAQIPIKSAKEYLFILLHGEDGKNATESFRIFNQGPGGGILGVLENTYGLKGHVYAYQMTKPSGSLATWTREFGDLSNSRSMLNRARADHKTYLRQTLDITDSIELEAKTPKTFIVIAHSFGGLVIRNYICSADYPGNIKALITINTPHSGSDYPYILEVLETRTALNKAIKIGTSAFKSIDAKDAISKAVETAYNLKKAYDNVTELLNDLNHYKDIINNIQQKVSAAEKQIRSFYPGTSFSHVLDTLQSSIQSLEKLATSTTSLTIDPKVITNIRSACHQYKFICDTAPYGYSSPPIGNLYIFCKGIEEAGLSLAEIAQDPNNDPMLCRALFSPEQFEKALAPSNFTSYYGEASADFQVQYPAIYSDALCVLNRPSLIFSGNDDLLKTYQSIKTIVNYSDTLSLDLQNLQSIPLPRLTLSPWKRLKNNQLMQSFIQIKSAINSLKDLQETPLSLENAPSLCASLFIAIQTLRQTLGNVDENTFFETWNDLQSIREDISASLQTQSFQKSMSQLIALRKYERALESLENLTTQESPSLSIKKGALVCNLENAVRLPAMLASAQVYGEAALISPPIDPLTTIKVDYDDTALRQTCAFLNLLKNQNISLSPPLPTGYPRITLPKVASNPLKLPSGIDTYEKIIVLSQSIFDCLEALKQAADIYYEIKEVADNIKEITAQLSEKDTGGSSFSKDDAITMGSDLLSSLLIGMCISKLIKPIENQAASSASFSTIATKFGKALLDGLWKEIENGALLEVGFAEASLRSTGVRPADPVMASMSKDNSSIDILKTQTPQCHKDTALNKTKYRIIYTKGVLTPTKSGTKTLDMVCGSGGTKALIRAKIEEAIENEINNLKNQLTDKVKSALEKLETEAAKRLAAKIPPSSRNVLSDAIKPNSDFEAAVDTARKYGVFEDYRSLIESQANALIDASADALAKTLDELVNSGLNSVISELEKLKEVKKALDFLDKLNPGLLISLYNTINSADESLTIGQKIFALYYSPLLKLGLYDNGDFISTAQSQQGNDVALFQQAADVRRQEYTVQDPLGPFAGIAALGIALDIAYYASLAAFPASAEPIRITKIASVNLLSIGTALAKRDELARYFIDGHKSAVYNLADPKKLDNLFFDKPYVSITLPDKK